MNEETPITREEFERVATQVAEIRAMLNAFAKALEGLQNHPMISAMLPRM